MVKLNRLFFLSNCLNVNEYLFVVRLTPFFLNLLLENRGKVDIIMM